MFYVFLNKFVSITHHIKTYHIKFNLCTNRCIQKAVSFNEVRQASTNKSIELSYAGIATSTTLL